MTAQLEIVAYTHRGLVRKRNEDSIWIGSWSSKPEMEAPYLTHRAVSTSGELLLLADGMGGHAAGDVASKFVVSELGSVSEEIEPVSIEKALNDINKKLLNYTFSDPNYRGMGSTIVGAKVRMDRSATIFNVGDSRAYIWGEQKRLVSVDDTLVDKRSAISNGLSLSHGITQCFGGFSANKTLIPHVTECDIADDFLMLCSDGLSDFVDFDKLQFNKDIPLVEIAQEMVEAALDAGGRDNISVVLCKFK